MATATQQANTVLEERNGAVLTLRMNRPDKLNALTQAATSILFVMRAIAVRQKKWKNC